MGGFPIPLYIISGTITIAYEVRVNGQCVKNVPYSDLSIARVFGVKFCEIRSALPLAVKFVLVRRCI